jgi:PAS domain S-box-containing protein
MRASHLALSPRHLVGAIAASIRRHAVGVGLFVCVCGLTLTGTLTPIDDALMDWRFGLFKRAPTNSLVVVEIDPESLAKLPGWPWSRSVHADVVRNLQAAGSRTIGFDVDFSSVSDADADGALRDALSTRPGDVVLPVFLQPESRGDASKGLRETAPHPYFLEHAAVAGVNLIVEPSGIARRGWYGTDTTEGYRSSFASSLAGVPANQAGSFYIDFSIDPAQLARLSFADVATGTFDPRAVSGRNVLVGATAVELGDEYSAPIYGLLPGVLLHALSYESLVQGRALLRVHPLFSLPLVVLVLAFLRRPRDDWPWTRSVVPHAAAFLALLVIPAAVQAVVPVSLDVGPVVAAQVLCIGLTTLSELERRARQVILHQREVARHQALIALVVRDSSDGIVITDELGKVVVFNNRAAELLGLKQSDWSGLPLSEVVPDFPVYAAHNEAQAQTVVAAERPSLQVSEYVPAGGDGTRTLEIVVDTTTYRERGEAQRGATAQRKVVAYSLRDITARKHIEKSEREAKQAAIAASQAKSHLIAAMSHELRTPLNAIIGFAQLLREESFGPLGSDSYRAFSTDIQKCGEHLLSVVNDILQVAKLEAGDIRIETDEFELKALVDGCIAEFAADIAGGRKTVSVRVPDQLVLNSDERLVRRALLQLLSNAVKFTREGDRIEVTASASEIDGVQIEIFDTGVGVGREHIRRLTEAFYQADASLSRGHEGMGLGLYLVNKYVGLLAGDLTLESDKDSFFRARIDLPVTCLSQNRQAA